MNQIAKISMLAIGAAMVSQALQAQPFTTGTENAANDLLLGFTSTYAGVTQDYILDLGQIPTQANTQLGGSLSLSTFNSIFGSTSSGALGNGAVNVSIVGGAPGSSTADIYTSTLSGAGAPPSITSGAIGSAEGNIAAINLGAVPQTLATGNTFSQNIISLSTPNTFAFDIGSTPATSVSSSGTVVLDIYSNAREHIAGVGTIASGWTYDGDIALDVSGSTLSAVFDPVAVPEPSTYGLLAGAGLLVVALRRQFVRKNA